MVWECFSYYGVGKLAFIETRMNANDYISILVRKLFTSATNMEFETFRLVQYNDPKHKSKVAMQFFQDFEIELIKWPAQSPDCNPIENLWAFVKTKIGNKDFQSIDGLKAAIEENRNKIPVILP